MKIKCIKIEKCPICGDKVRLHVFFNKQNKLKYARTRHYALKDEEGYNPMVKYNFRYCKIEDLNQLETLLISVNFQFPTVKAQNENLGQKTTVDFHDHSSVCLLSGQTNSSLNFKMAGPLGFEPRTFSLEG
jgi:hypothetical protein